MNRRAKIVTLSAMALGLAVLVVGAVALSDPIAEWWYIRQVKLGDPEAKETAARKLGAKGSVRAIPVLLEMAGRDLVQSEKEFQPLLQIVAKRRREALRALLAGLTHPRPEVRRFAALALAKVEPADEKAARAARALLHALRTESTTRGRRVRRVLKNSLERIRPELDGDMKWEVQVIREGVDLLWPNPLVAPPRSCPAA